MSFFGDLHPSFSGNVVKAMGSAKQGYPVVSRVLARRPGRAPSDGPDFLASLNAELRARVHRVERLTPTIVEVVVHAPLAARQFRPGQFYRLRNFETLAPTIDGTRLAMEGLALTGAWVDRERGLVSTIVLEMGGSSDLCAFLKPGEPVVLMGPTGMPTEKDRWPLTDAQVAANVALVRDLARRFPITHLLGHHEVASFAGHPYFVELVRGYRNSKPDPGARFIQRVRAAVADLALAGP